jgi:WD40 repeat protein
MSQQELRILKGYIEAMISIAFNPAGDLLASGSYDNTIKL